MAEAANVCRSDSPSEIEASGATSLFQRAAETNVCGANNNSPAAR